MTGDDISECQGLLTTLFTFTLSGGQWQMGALCSAYNLGRTLVVKPFYANRHAAAEGTHWPAAIKKYPRPLETLHKGTELPNGTMTVIKCLPDYHSTLTSP